MSAQITKSKASVPSDGKSKYLKRSQIEAEREAAYAAEQVRLENEREDRAYKKRKLEDEETEKARIRDEKKRKLIEESRLRREEDEARQDRLRRKRLGLPEISETKTDGKETTPLRNDEVDIPDAELTQNLRAIHEPITLFAETHKARLRRYRNLTSPNPGKALTKGPIPSTLAPVPASDLIIPSTPTPPSKSPERHYLFRQLASYFHLLLTEWNSALSSRPESVKTSQPGLQALANYTSTVTNLTPLIRRLEADSPTDLPDTLLGPIISIVRDCQARRYVSANDGYLKLSIGKAAWPIGVTMVGIHERSAREKLHESDKQAHIMSDEVTRKMLQAIKRCLSYAQTRWPPEDMGQLMG